LQSWQEMLIFTQNFKTQVMEDRYGVTLSDDGKVLLRAPEDINEYAVPQGVEVIEDSAFWRCSRLTAVSLPEGVAVIGRNAFNGCSALAEVVLPEGLEVIRESAFRYSHSLVRVTLPASVETIGKDAFSGCTSLQHIVVPQGAGERFRALLPGLEELVEERS